MDKKHEDAYDTFKKCLLQLTVLDSFIAEKTKKLSEIEPELKGEEKEKVSAMIRSQS